MEQTIDLDVIKQVELAKSGDIWAFESLIESNEKLIYNLCLRIMGDLEDAKDVSQEVFIKAYKNISKFDSRSKFSTWLYSIASNTCIDEIRKRRGKKVISLDKEVETGDENFKLELADNEPLPEEKLIKKENNSEILKALNKLQAEYKEVLILREINELSYDEISDIIKLPLGTVKSRISRARTMIKKEFLKLQEQTW